MGESQCATYTIHVNTNYYLIHGFWKIETKEVRDLHESRWGIARAGNGNYEGRRGGEGSKDEEAVERGKGRGRARNPKK